MAKFGTFKYGDGTKYGGLIIKVSKKTTTIKSGAKNTTIKTGLRKAIIR